MECELNERLIKLEEDGELYYWYDYCGGRLIKNPYWKKYKQTIDTDINGRQYKIIKADSRKFKVHRVIYFIHNYMEWDIWDTSRSNLIDHIDNNGLNNNIENLRVVTHQENMWNKGAKHIHITKQNTYRVEIRGGDIRFRKTFKTEQEAIDAVAEFKLKYRQF